MKCNRPKLGLRHIIVPLAFLALGVQCHDANAADCNGAWQCQHPTDYILHAGAGWAIASAMEKRGYSKWQTFATVGAVALLKEYAIDKNPDPADAAAFLIGPVIHFEVKF